MKKRKMNGIIFVNSDASKLDDLFLNKDVSFSELDDNVFSVRIAKNPTDMIVKTYKNKKKQNTNSRLLIKSNT